jgi:hypothetical protein
MQSRNVAELLDSVSNFAMNTFVVVDSLDQLRELLDGALQFLETVEQSGFAFEFIRVLAFVQFLLAGEVLTNKYAR